ncbi:proline iminopeptidase, putative [Talaromyces stipitatus ATCC 10500]|uniref:Proline iminopeptidase, putative n=1 Tax=Talaromyces stipitatus (strain ATCC 10500 / CBS 375.48 / QM 6759 / NRRL 1006) TaxID=441959 RepID=B8MFR2_TALSN|nr:proline iminopeptidase, putative [Talaromyces stipitatus ATCC 10500]EED17052.1 proline iminopeptidase, putative [Talaromyces stipitatus ATCC 10500]
MVEYITINGARLAYEISGPETAPLMITLHGGRGMGDHRSDYKIYSQLNDRLQVLSFDYRGHGQSSRTKPYTFEQLVDDIEGIRQQFLGAEEQVIICGGSFGGFLALHYAIKYASRVSRLILRGAAASHHRISAFSFQQHALLANLTTDEEDSIKSLEKRLHKAPNFSKEMLRDKVFGAYEDDEEFKLVYFAMMPLYKEVFDANAALKACRDTVCFAESHNELYSEKEKYFDYTKKLASITAKTLVIVGENDWICPPENSRIIAERIPGAELLVVSDANHSVHIEKPETVLGRIKEFL